MKKFWKALAAIGISAALCVPLAACGEDGATTDQERLYESYVLYAQAAGDEVLSYQEWLDSVRGAAGEDGKSAYEIAVENGFEGTEEEWLASLKGQDGEDGKDGADGDKGDKGDPGEKGEQGDKGDKGDKGDPGEKGEQGDKGDKGEQGVGIKDITYSYGYNAEEGYFYTEITFILTDKQEKTVIVPSAMNPETTYVATTAAELKGLLEDGAAQVALGADIQIEPIGSGNGAVPQIVIDSDTTIDLQNYTISFDYDGETSYSYVPVVFNVRGADVVIVGNGTIDTELGYTTAYGINITENGSLTINGGHYYGAMSAVQVQKGALIVNDGYFALADTIKQEAPEYANYIVNCIDSAYNDGTATIELYGGVYPYDMSNNPEGEGTSYLAEGYGVTASEQDGETVYTVLKVSENPGETFLANNAAEVEALMAAGVENISLGADIKMNLVIEKGQTLALDLNGHTLTNAGDHTITNYGQLTIDDSGEEATGVVDNITHAKAALHNDVKATAVLNGGTFTRSQENGQSAENSGENSFYAIRNYGNMTINEDVTVSQRGHYSSLLENGWYNGSENISGTEAVLTINGGNFVGGLNTIKNDDWGNLTIYNGTFENVSQAVVLNWNIATIAGGNYSASEGAVAIILNGYINDTMDKGDLTIKSIEYSGAVLLQQMGGSTNSGTITVCSEDAYKAAEAMTGEKKIVLAGGTYTSDPETFPEYVSIAEGYGVTASEQDGVWVVMPEQA